MKRFPMDRKEGPLAITAEIPDGLASVQVVILARGEGSRLRPFTLTRPKALCPVCNVPVLGRLLIQLRAAGFTRATVALPLVPDEAWREAQLSFPQDLQVDGRMSAQPSLGSIPAVMDCLDSEASQVLVIYGDSLLRADITKLLAFHRSVRQAGGAATLFYHQPADRFTPEMDGRTYHGILSTNTEGQVTRFVEKPLVSKLHSGFDLANAAVFMIERSFLENFALRGAIDFSRNLFEPAVQQHIFPIYAIPIVDGYRHDVGSVARLFEANMKILTGEWAATIPGKQSVPGIWAGDSVSLEGANLKPPVLLGDKVSLGANCEVGPGVILGRGCDVREGAVLRNALLLQNCTIGARAHVESCVLGSNSRVGCGVQLPPYSALGDFSLALGDGWPSVPSPPKTGEVL